MPAPTNKKSNDKKGNEKNRTKTILITTKFFFREKIQPLYRLLPKINRFIENNIDFDVIILGDGTFKQDIENLTKEFSMSDNFIFKGYVDDTSMYYQSSFCLIHASGLDGYPSVIDEARINSLPVIVSNSVGLAEMIDNGIDGFYLDNAFNNLDYILNTLQNPVINNKIIQNSLLRLERLNSHKIIGMELIKAIGSILDIDQTNNIKVAYVIKRIDKIAGSQRQLDYLAKGLKNNIDSYVYDIMDSATKSIQIQSRQNIDIKPTRISSPGFIKKSIELAKDLKRNKIDIIQAYGFEASVVSAIAAIITRIPLISARREIADWRKFKHLMAFAFINIVSRKITVNSSAVLDITNNEFFSLKKTILIRNGIELHAPTSNTTDNLLKKEPGIIVVGMIANYRKVKNIPMLINAAKILQPTYPHIQFWIAGEGDERPALERMINELSLENVVFLTGQINNIKEFLSNVDIFTLTSVAEGSPNAVLEAMVEGIPVIATNVGGVPDLIKHDKTGYLINSNDHQQLSQRIIDLISSPLQAKSLGDNGKVLSHELFDLNRLYKDQLTLFKGIINKSN